MRALSAAGTAPDAVNSRISSAVNLANGFVDTVNYSALAEVQSQPDWHLPWPSNAIVLPLSGTCTGTSGGLHKLLGSGARKQFAVLGCLFVGM